MELAKKKLHSSTATIEEVAYQCGFNGLVSFSRKFKQELGCSPSEFRKKMIKDDEIWYWRIPINEKEYNQFLTLIDKNIWLEKLMVFLIENLDNESCAIDELSKVVYMSPSTLNRKTQGLFGVTVSRLLRDLRLQYAAELLNIQAKSVNETAILTGFFDAAHLSKHFKQIFKCSPGEYRNTNLEFSCIKKLKEELMCQIDK